MNWIKLQAGRAAILSYDMNIPIRDLFIDVLKKTGVMFTPISALDVEGSMRSSCADALHITEEGLIRFSAYLKKYA